MLNNEIVSQTNLPQTDHLKLIHEIHDISELNDLLEQISGKEVILREVSASLEIMNSRLKYEFYSRPYGSYGINEPSLALLDHWAHMKVMSIPSYRQSIPSIPPSHRHREK
jgi:hypothetical protein